MEIKNIFHGGLNTDLDNNVIPQNTYKDAQNITLVNDNGYLSVQNLKGASVEMPNAIPLSEITSGVISSSNVRILGGVRIDYLNSEVLTDAILFFYIISQGGTHTLKAKAYLMDGSSIVEMFSEEYNDSRYTSCELSYLVYGEGGYDNVYFTVGVGSIKKIRCSSEFTGYGEYECTLNRHMPLGVAPIISVSEPSSPPALPPETQEASMNVTIDNNVTGHALTNVNVRMEFNSLSYSAPVIPSVADGATSLASFGNTTIVAPNQLIHPGVVAIYVEFDEIPLVTHGIEWNLSNNTAGINASPTESGPFVAGGRVVLLFEFDTTALQTDTLDFNITGTVRINEFAP